MKGIFHNMGFWEDAKYIASQDPAATGPLLPHLLQALSLLTSLSLPGIL